MNILVTGANGFIGRNLTSWLRRESRYNVLSIDVNNSWAELDSALAAAEFVVHLAGVNRPQSDDEFRVGNVGFTQRVCGRLLELRRAVPLLLTSSIQVALENPYGISKQQAEAVVTDYAERSGARVVIYRLKNVYGKWCRPNYNSVVATFCHNIAHDLPIRISDPERVLEMVYIDDVVRAMMIDLQVSQPGGAVYTAVEPFHQVSLGHLADLIRSFREMRTSLVTPSMGDALVRNLYATYLSYLPTTDFAYSLSQRTDARGSLAEFIKSPNFGQIFVSRTRPGITRGNHYHHTKVEKFLVLEGEAVIRFRHLASDDVIEYPVRGEEFRVVDIPPGYTHSIENVGSGELITLFWADEIFDPASPDTAFLPVLS